MRWQIDVLRQTPRTESVQVATNTDGRIGLVAVDRAGVFGLVADAARIQLRGENGDTRVVVLVDLLVLPVLVVVLVDGVGVVLVPGARRVDNDSAVALSQQHTRTWRTRHDDFTLRGKRIEQDLEEAVVELGAVRRSTNRAVAAWRISGGTSLLDESGKVQVGLVVQNGTLDGVKERSVEVGFFETARWMHVQRLVAVDEIGRVTITQRETVARDMEVLTGVIRERDANDDCKEKNEHVETEVRCSLDDTFPINSVIDV